MKGHRKIWALVLVFAVFANTVGWINPRSAAAFEGRYSYLLYPGNGYTTGDKNPEIVLYIINNVTLIEGFEVSLDKDKIDNSQLKINLANNLNGSVTFTPKDSLKAGRHSIKIRIIFDAIKHSEIESSFSVSENVPDPYLNKNLSILQRYEMEGIAEVNKLRQGMGLPPMKSQDSLARAAQAHANYLLQDMKTSHEEEKDKQGFVGVNPSDRVQLFGYSRPIGECIASGTRSAATAVNGLMDAPYHRLAIIDPNFTELGIGHTNEGVFDYSVIDFGNGGFYNGSEVMLYPYPGQTDAKIGWFVNENPNPMEGFGLEKVFVGYPISISVHDFETQEIRAESISLRDAAGQEVPFYKVDASNDKESKCSVFLIPRLPLKPGEGYTINALLKRTKADNKSDMFLKHWSFTTLGEIRLSSVDVFSLDNEEKMSVNLANGDLFNTTYILEQGDKVIENKVNVQPGGALESMLDVPAEGNYVLRIENPLFEKPAVYDLRISSDVLNGKVASWSEKEENSIRVLVNGRQLSLNTEPLVIQGHTMVPLRDIFNALGVDVSWDEKNRTVVGTRAGIVIKLPVGKTAAQVNDGIVELEVGATIADGRTLVPVRFIAESLGAKVAWDGTERIVSITN